MRLIRTHGASQEPVTKSKASVKISLLPRTEHAEEPIKLIQHSVNLSKQLIQPQWSELVKKLHKVLKLERKVEAERVKINQICDFDPLLLFSYFDKYWVKSDSNTSTNVDLSDCRFESKQYLDMSQFKSWLKKIGVSPTSHRLKAFFIRYNKTQNGRLSLHEFLDIFIPKEFDLTYFKPADENLIQKVKECDEITEFMTVETLFRLRDFVAAHLKVDKVVERLFDEMQSLAPFDALNDFKCCNIALNSTLSTDLLQTVFVKFKLDANDAEVLTLVQRLSSVSNKLTFMDLACNKGKMFERLYRHVFDACMIEEAEQEHEFENKPIEAV